MRIAGELISPMKTNGERIKGYAPLQKDPFLGGMRDCLLLRTFGSLF
jgi:hypothetical protein